MPKKLNEEGVRIHLLLHTRDIERIDRIFANPRRANIRSMKRSETIRLIIGKFLDQVEAQAQHKTKPAEAVDLDDLLGEDS